MKDNIRISWLEGLLAAIILAAVAANVVPRLTVAGTEARVSTLVERLQTMRAQIELYKVQHTDKLVL